MTLAFYLGMLVTRTVAVYLMVVSQQLPQAGMKSAPRQLDGIQEVALPLQVTDRLV